MHKKFVVRLSDEERGVCQEIIKHLKGSSPKFRRAQMLLKTDADGPAWCDVRIAEAFNCRVQTIETLRKRLVTEGVAWALEGKKRQAPPTPCKRDGEAEAQWMALRLGKPPSGYGHWTLHLLADEMVRWDIIDAISDETVRKVLKKTA
jgi:homeodomain-containing protein